MGSENRPKILCVEDHSDACELIHIVLPGFEIISITTKHEAIDKALDGGFSLIIMDYYLPDGTGEEACRVIRQFDRKTPILFITSSVTFNRAKALSAGAQDLLQKASPRFLEDLQARSMELVFL
jgi:CheY-like chemotaxis protein